MRVEVGGKYIAAPDLQNLGAMGELHSHFDHGIIFYPTDYARDPGPGLELVRDQVNTVCDFHALLTVAGVAEGAPHVGRSDHEKIHDHFSQVIANVDFVQAICDELFIFARH